MVCDWSTVDSWPVGHTSHTHVVMSNCLHRTCLNRYYILGPSKTVRDWWNEEFRPVDKINVSRMWIGLILLGLENHGFWFVEQSFSASGENRIHTHRRYKTMASSMNRGFFFGPLRDWSTVAFGPLDNQKDHRKPEIWFQDFFSIYGFFENLGYQNLLFLWYSWISSFFQIYLFNANLHKRRARCDERVSERASGSCLFFRRRRRSCRRVPVSTFSRSLVVRCERRRRRGNKKLLKNFKKKIKFFVRVFFF